MSLKEQGNKAFREREWDQAITFYTKALEENKYQLDALHDKVIMEVDNSGEDDDSAKTCDMLREHRVTLFSNRSAANIHSYRYDLALLDATCASALNPKWSRAVARRAEAFAQLQEHQKAKDAYTTAIGLAEDEVTAGRYRRSLEAVTAQESAHQILRQRPELLVAKPEDTVYARYLKKAESAKNRGELSEFEQKQVAAASATLAFQSCEAANEHLEQLVEDSNGRVTGVPVMAMQYVSECLIADTRGFHPPPGGLPAMNAYFRKLSQQALFDAVFHKCGHWVDSAQDGAKRKGTSKASTKEILDELDLRVEQDKDWKNARMALSSLLRSKLVLGFCGEVCGDIAGALVDYDRVLDLLLTASQRWADVPNSDRGNIFAYTWTRKAKVIYMQALQKAYVQKIKTRDGESVTLEEITILAESVITDCATTSNMGGGVVTYHAFQLNPISLSGCAIGFCLGEKARMKENRTNKGPLWYYHSEMSLAAAKMYRQAAQTMPEDDPERAIALYFALMYDLRGGAGYTLGKVFELVAVAERAYTPSEELFGPGQREIEPRIVVRSLCEGARESTMRMDLEPYFEYSIRLDLIFGPAPDCLAAEFSKDPKPGDLKKVEWLTNEQVECVHLVPEHDF